MLGFHFVGITNSLPANDAADVADKVSEGLTGDEGEPICDRNVLGPKSEEARGEALAGPEWFGKVSPTPSCCVGEIFGKTVYYLRRTLNNKLSYHSNWLTSRFLQANNFFDNPKWFDHLLNFLLTKLTESWTIYLIVF